MSSKPPTRSGPALGVLAVAVTVAIISLSFTLFMKREAAIGRGPARGGLGLLGIRERLVNLCGRLTITSRIGEGTQIAVAVPMERR